MTNVVECVGRVWFLRSGPIPTGIGAPSIARQDGGKTVLVPSNARRSGLAGISQQVKPALFSHWYTTRSGLRGILELTQGRASQSRSNLGLNDAILSD